MGRLIEVARTLRERERFGGYIHLKAIPGCGDKLIEKGRPLRRQAIGQYRAAHSLLPSPSRAAEVRRRDTWRDALHGPGGGRKQGRPASLAARRGAPPPSRPRARAPSSSSERVPTTTRRSSASPGPSTADWACAASTTRLSFPFRRPPTPPPRQPAPRPRASPLPGRLAPPLLRLTSQRRFSPKANPNLPADIDPKTAWALRHPDFSPWNRHGRIRRAASRSGNRRDRCRTDNFDADASPDCGPRIFPGWASP